MPACPFCGLGGTWGRPARQLRVRVRGRPAPPQTHSVCGQRLTVNHRARPSRGPDVHGNSGCDPSQGRSRREGCRGASGGAPRGTEPAARSGASGNGLSLSSRLSRPDTQLSCTRGQRGRTPWPNSPAGISAHRAVPRVLLGLGSIRESLGWGTLSSLCCFILTQSDSGSKLPSSGKLTPGLSL